MTRYTHPLALYVTQSIYSTHTVFVKYLGPMWQLKWNIQKEMKKYII